MSNVTINCDIVARACGKSISHARAYLAATTPDNEIDYFDGITEATIAYGNAELVLHNLEPYQEDERERFAELRKNALDAIMKFQKRFKVAALPMPSGSVGTLHHTSEGMTKPVFNSSRVASNTQRATTRKAYTSRGHLDETKVKEIKKHVKELGRQPKQSDYNEMAELYDVTDQTIRNVVTGTSWSHVSI